MAIPGGTLDYRIPFGWIEESVEGRPDGAVLYKNITTGLQTSTRPTRGVYSEEAVLHHGVKLLVPEVRVIRPAMEKARALPAFRTLGNDILDRRIPRRSVPPTLNSQRFHPSFHSLHEYENKSGISPPPFHEAHLLTAPGDNTGLESRAEDEAVDEFVNLYISSTLNAWSLEALWDVEAIDPYNNLGVGQNTLTNEILPFLKDYWLTPGPAMVGAPNRFWDLDNPEVKRAMDPVLRLCSRFITSFGTGDWWDALIKGRKVPIDPRRVPPRVTEQIFCLKKRLPEEKLSDPIDWTSLNGQIDFSFISGIKVGAGKKNPEQIRTIYGVTTHHAGFPFNRTRPLVFLAWPSVEPLLQSYSPPLSPSLRLVKNFQLAKTLLHEIAHAVQRSRPDWVQGQEPLFEDESARELGRSMENSTFGGRIAVVPNYKAAWGLNSQGIAFQPVTNLYCRLETWPSQDDRKRYGPQLLDKPCLRDDSYPISIEWLEDVQQDLFWEIGVKKLGPEAINYDAMQGIALFYKEDPPGQVKYERKSYTTSAWYQNRNNWENLPPPSPILGQTSPLAAFARRREQRLWRMAHRITLRFDERKEAGLKRSRWSDETKQKVRTLKDQLKGMQRSYRTFYENDSEQIEDLIASKGHVGDLGLRRLPMDWTEAVAARDLQISRKGEAAKKAWSIWLDLMYTQSNLYEQIDEQMIQEGGPAMKCWTDLVECQKICALAARRGTHAKNRALGEPLERFGPNLNYEYFSGALTHPSKKRYYWPGEEKVTPPPEPWLKSVLPGLLFFGNNNDGADDPETICEEEMEAAEEFVEEEETDHI